MNTLAFTLGEYRSQLTLKISTYPNGNLAIKLYEKDHGILIFWETLTTNLTGIRPDYCAFINIKAADGLFPVWLSDNHLADPTCEDWREISTDSATPITAAGGVWMGVPPPCPSGSRHLTLLMAANSSSRRKVPHSKLPSSMQMVQRSSASIGVKRTWQPS